MDLDTPGTMRTTEKNLPRRDVYSRWHSFCLLVVCCAPAFPDSVARQMDIPLGLPQIESAADNSKAQLGERLFFDKRLSVDRQVSCGSCHLAEHSFTDRRPRSKGHRDILGTRNAPSLLNAVYLKNLFWDGRAESLAQQARAPFINPVEHAFGNERELLRIVGNDPEYAAEFARLWPISADGLRMNMVTDALAAYEQTLLAGNSPFDRFYYAKDAAALNDAARRGFELFRGRANCAGCHPVGEHWSLLTDQKFHVAARGLPPAVSGNLPVLAQRVTAAKNQGDQQDLERLIATDTQIAALGRFLVTLDPTDIGKFKTPSLRNVALTAPYMHDGSVPTLEEAVDLELYSRGVVTYPIILTRAEKDDLMEYLKALSSER